MGLFLGLPLGFGGLGELPTALLPSGIFLGLPLGFGGLDEPATELFPTGIFLGLPLRLLVLHPFND
jgi:hypothetical protein